jgi:hypothetical protein
VLHTSLSEEMPLWGLSLCFFWFGWRTFPESWRSGFGQVLRRVRRGYPKERQTFRRAQDLRGAAESARLSPCQQSKTVSLKGFGVGWVLLGIYPLTIVGEMAEGRSRGEQEQRQSQDTQRYVRRFVGYVVGRRRDEQ